MRLPMLAPLNVRGAGSGLRNLGWLACDLLQSNNGQRTSRRYHSHGSPGLGKDPHRIPSLPKRLIRPIIVSNGSRWHGNLTRDLSELEPFSRKVPVVPA
jgi:hypothetical protein